MLTIEEYDALLQYYRDVIKQKNEVIDALKFTIKVLCEAHTKGENVNRNGERENRMMPVQPFGWKLSTSNTFPPSLNLWVRAPTPLLVKEIDELLKRHTPKREDVKK